MWLAWKKYANFLVFIGISACSTKTQELQNNLILSDTALQRYTGFLPQVNACIFIKDLNIMINLAEITKIKSSPYYLELENGTVRKIESLAIN